MRRIEGIVAALALALAGCTSVQTEQAYSGPRLARPDVIVVYDFAVAPGEVQLGHGLIADVDQAMQGTPRTEQEQKAGQLVAAAFAKHLVAEIRDLGLPAEHAADGAPAAQGASRSTASSSRSTRATASSAW